MFVPEYIPGTLTPVSTDNPDMNTTGNRDMGPLGLIWTQISVNNYSQLTNIHNPTKFIANISGAINNAKSGAYIYSCSDLL